MSPLAAIVLAVFADLSAGAAPPRAHRAGGVACDAQHHCVVRRAVVDKWLADSDALAKSVRVVPALVDGKPDGFKLYAMRPHSILTTLGFKNGDTLQMINGYELTSPQNALLAYMQLRNASEFAVRIVRHGEPLTLTYEIQ